tara:strand:- start:6 stop:560 length:555 start_codon:yes stop_codon:yes gene_type:complete
MADKHKLSLEVPAVADCTILSVNDTSQYTPLLPVDCPELLITVPGFNSPALISVTQDFSLNLVACNLGVQTVDCGTTNTDLPDGVYIIKYSVAPNDEVFVEYNHLRITKILNLYHEVLCGLHVDTCEPSSERWELIGEIHYIRTLIDAAVSQVEYCCSPTKGMDMYNYALKRLQKILCLTSSNC